VLVRVHRGTLLPDVLDSAAGEGALKAAMGAIAKEGRGVLLYLRKPIDALRALQPAPTSNDESVPGHADQTRLREFGVGAQILTDLGLSQLKLLTNHPKQIVGLDSYGLKVVAQLPLSPRRSPRK
jgi:3,4-dihydroxy 2-butanone 4-phosphate synthase/GTP cyclohydrolase II